jgi:hypothetical protein
MNMKTRFKTRDVAFQFRMGAGNPGDVNRTHPAGIEAALQNATNPNLIFGGAAVVDTTTQTVRRTIAGDSAITNVYGFTVRSYPTQSPAGGQFGSETLGSAVPPATGVIDILRSGYIMAKLPSDAAAAKKGGQVFIWVAASSGTHTQGGVEMVASSGNTAALANTTFNGTQDANGVVEVAHNI